MASQDQLITHSHPRPQTDNFCLDFPSLFRTLDRPLGLK